VSNPTAISIRNLSKSFTIVHDEPQHITLAETLLHRMRHPFRKMERETFWALKDVSLEIGKGEVVGIIGRNGAGKSTLLKILSRITEPTQGEIALYGRIGSLLEVGTGFHPELTGRENIFLNGAILGMRRKEIEEQFDQIVDFAGVDKFLDTPVKRYSSGMYVRLAFAVAAHLRSEIMVVDEVLAVGDAEFQNKCLGKMQDVASSGRTVLFVSHQMQAVSTLCTRAVYLEQGRVKYSGEVRQAINHYLQYAPRTDNTEAAALRRPGSGEARVTSVTTDKAVYLSTDTITLEAKVTAIKSLPMKYFVSVEVINGYGQVVLHLDSRLLNQEFACDRARTIRYEIQEPRLAQGQYRVSLFLCSASGVIDRFDRATEISIAPILPYPTSRGDAANLAMVYPAFTIEQVESEERDADGVAVSTRSASSPV